MAIADDYATLIDPTRPYAKVATAPDCRYQIAPLTIDLGKGSTDARRHITEPEWSYLWF